MTDLFDDDDLFAIRPTPAPPPPPAPAPPAPPVPDVSTPPAGGFAGPRWPCASLACPCGAQEEVQEPCPDRLDCWKCNGLETMRRIVPRYLPPRSAGRHLTELERRGLALDKA